MFGKVVLLLGVESKGRYVVRRVAALVVYYRNRVVTYSEEVGNSSGKKMSR